MDTTTDVERLLSQFKLTPEPDSKILDNEQDITETVCNELRDKYRLPNCDDKVTMLQLWLYRKYYTQPEQPVISPAANANVADINFEADSGITQIYWQSDYWRYPDGKKPPSTSSTNFVLTRGSEAQWAETGRFLEVGFSEAEQWTLIRTSRPTNSFDKSLKNDKYNWVYSQRASANDWAGSIRFYFNLKPTLQAASVLMRQIRSSFDLYNIPFSLKFPVTAEQYDRADSAVLYTEHRYLFIISHLLWDVYAALIDSDSLRTETVPLFTALVAPGLSVAEDPFSGSSFGLNRCSLLAQAIETVRHVQDMAERLKQSVSFIEDQGYFIDRFYRNPGSIVEYSYLMNLFSRNLTPDNKPVRRLKDPYRTIRFNLSDENEWFELPGYNQKRYLVAAVRIALDLCRETYWHLQNGRWQCNWMSYRPGAEPDTVTYSLLNDSRNEGVVGIKLFLKQVYKLYNSAIIKAVITYMDSSVSAGNALVPPVDVAWKNDYLDSGIKIIFDNLAVKTDGQSVFSKYRENFFKGKYIANYDLGDHNNPYFTTRQAGGLSAFLVGKPSDNYKASPDLADELIEDYLNTGRPLGNGYKSEKPELNDLFCPNLKYGLAGIGYFFLMVYDPLRFQPIHLD